jgi:hypothetical protein
MLVRMRKRAMPYVGRPVTVIHLGAMVDGVVDAVGADGRELQVLTEEGETLRFVLDPATAGFTLAGGQTQARLRFLDE